MLLRKFNNILRRISQKPKWSAILIGFLSSTILIFFTLFFDNTTHITTNGLYKAIALMDHLTGSQRFDPNHPLYNTFMVNFWKFSGITNLPVTTLAKIALVNSIVGGILLGFLWLILWQISKNVISNLSIIALYFFSSYFLFLATESEDIIPAMAFFVASIYFLMSFFQHRKMALLLTSSILFSISFLLHRTLIIGVPAFMLALFVYEYNIRRWGKTNLLNIKKIGSSITSSLIFLTTTIFTTSLLIKHPSLVLWPQIGDSGWLGFSWSKFSFTFISGIGQSILLGRNQTNLEDIFRQDNLIVEAFTLALVLFIVFKLFLISLRDKRLVPPAIFFVSNFWITEAINLTTQGQDPQFQLPALVIIPVAIGSIYASSNKSTKQKLQQLIVVLLVVVAFINLSLVIKEKGNDSRKIGYINQVSSLVDYKKSVFLTHGFDELPSWGMYVWQVKQEEKFIGFTTYLVSSPQLDPQETAQKTLEFLEKAHKQGNQIIATNIINATNEEITSQLASVDSSGKKGIAIKEALLENYNEEFLGNTINGPLYLLNKK